MHAKKQYMSDRSSYMAYSAENKHDTAMGATTGVSGGPDLPKI